MESNPDEELLRLTKENQISIRFNQNDGSIDMYDHLGHFECSEQALLALIKYLDEQEE